MENIYYYTEIADGTPWGRVNTFRIETQCGVFQITCDGDLDNALRVLKEFILNEMPFLLNGEETVASIASGTLELEVLSATKIDVNKGEAGDTQVGLI